MWCEVLGIDVPSVESVVGHTEAKPRALLIVALLERGEPMTLDAVAERLARAGVGQAADIRRSLSRCRPGASPLYRDGDLYGLDPHDRELDLLVFILGLRPPAVRAPRLLPKPDPVGGPDEPLSLAELEEAIQDAHISSWSSQRTAMAVLDAHGQPMRGEEVHAFVQARAILHTLGGKPRERWQAGAPIQLTADGRWALQLDHEGVPKMRAVVRERVAKLRQQRASRPSRAEVEAGRQARQLAQAAEREALAAMRRLIVHAFPPEAPEQLVVIDVQAHTLRSFVGDLEPARALLAEADMLIGLGIREQLRGLAIDPGARRLADLAPPQKSMRRGPGGKTLTITLDLLLRATCGIRKPLGKPKRLRQLLREGKRQRVQRQLEQDAQSLTALYRYGWLHGCLWVSYRGAEQEMIPAPWRAAAEPSLHRLIEEAGFRGRMMEVVEGDAPPWDDPWRGALRCRPVAVRLPGTAFEIPALLGPHGVLIEEFLIQRIREVP